MGALPKERISRARQGRRRGHINLVELNLISCPQCHQMRMSHHVCPHCGTYKGVEVITPKTARRTGE
jgi:large subunit ribosomal protein L32